MPTGERTAAQAAEALNGKVPVREVQRTYSHAQFNALVERTFKRVNQLSALKGGEYSGDVDRLLNFRRNGAALGLPMETIWAVYAAKHWDAIVQWIKDNQLGQTRPREEAIEGRVTDLIVYLLLFRAMLEERE